MADSFTPQDRHDLATVLERTTNIQGQIKALRESSVTKSELWPIKAIVYGLAGIILTAVGVAIVSLVLRSTS